MRIARRDGDDAGEVVDLNGFEAVGGRVVAELALRVLAPGPDRAVVQEGE